MTNNEDDLIKKIEEEMGTLEKMSDVPNRIRMPDGIGTYVATYHDPRGEDIHFYDLERAGGEVQRTYIATKRQKEGF